MQLSVVNTCILPLLPLLPIAMIWAWLKIDAGAMGGNRTGPRRIWIALALLALVILAMIRVSQVTLVPSWGAFGFVLALWIVTTHPVWFVLGLLGFVHLMIFPIADEERRRVSRILLAAALFLFGLTMLWFVVSDPQMTASVFNVFIRFTPLNLSVGAAFAVASKFLFDHRIKDRQISMVTLLMIALFVGGVGAMVFSDL
jgi:hypothetical protein